jgi:putative membrane protein
VTVPLTIAAVAASVAAGTHGFMFVVESVLYGRSRVLRMLEVAELHAPAVRLWAYHQGVYNLVLAAMSAGGVIALGVAAITTGRTLLLASNAAMVIAALALLGVDRRRERLQGFFAQALPASICLLALEA